MKPDKLLAALALNLTLTLTLTLAGCASTGTAPLARLGLKLAPSQLGEAVSLQQHLTVERGGRIDELDVALEIDASHIEMVGLAFGQRVLSIAYDGKEMTSWRHLMLPRQVRADDVLEDMQLTLWPVAAIAASLPPGWRIEEHGAVRKLFLDDALVATITYAGQPRWNGTIVMDNLRYQYKLTIQSAP